jgi:hypothetical protein
VLLIWRPGYAVCVCLHTHTLTLINLAEHVARMGKMRNLYKILFGKPERKRLFGRPRRRWKFMTVFASSEKASEDCVTFYKNYASFIVLLSVVWRRAVKVSHDLLHPNNGTEQISATSSADALHLARPRSESQTSRRLSWLTSCVLFLSTQKRMPVQYLKTNQSRLSPVFHRSAFMIISSSHSTISNFSGW